MVEKKSNLESRFESSIFSESTNLANLQIREVYGVDFSTGFLFFLSRAQEYLKKKKKYDVPSENLEELKLSLLGVGKVRAFLLVSLKKRFTNWGWGKS